MKVLIVGGFEPSGHDAVLTAITEDAGESGMTVESIAWRQMIPGIDDHVVFHLHRMRSEGPSLSGLMDDSALADYLARDLWRRLPNLSGFDAVICVHPWSSVIVAHALKEQMNSSTVLADCNVNWGAIPDIEVPRINVFCGGLVRRPVRPTVWNRCIPTGVPVRRTFSSDSTETISGKVCIATGRLGQSTDLAISAYNKFKSVISPSQVVVAGASQREGQWHAALGKDVDAVFVPDIDDISPYWHGAEWVITKASASSVAEAFAVGAKVIGMASGVLWEDTCLAILASRGAIIPVDLLSEALTPPNITYWREFTLAASLQCVSLVANVYAGTLPRPHPTTPVPLVPTSSVGADLLPETSRWLNKALRRWNADN